MPKNLLPILASASAILGLSAQSHAVLFQADSAVAGSTYSAIYTINNTINGSGLPANFGPSDPHAPYTSSAGGNHWTTAANAILNNTAWAEYSFNSDVTMGTFYMWNHQSNGGLASNPDYDVTLFDLRLYDAGNNVLLELLNQVGQEDVTTAQLYTFGPVSGVRKVRIDILANARANNDSYTGLAEVAFDTQAVPEPATMAIGAFALAGYLVRRKK